MIKLFPFLPTIIAVVSILSCNGQQDQAESPDAFIVRKADSLYKAEKVPGIFIGVLNNGKRSYYHFGYADPDRKEIFDSSTAFEIGSITKTFTAYVLEKVLSEKSISDTSSIMRYLPDSVQQNKALQLISFLSLLNHTSGLPRLPNNMDLASKQPYENYSKDNMFSFLKSCKPADTGKYVYSNLGFGLAAVLASTISGKSYTDLLKHYIFSSWQIREGGDDRAITRKSKGFFDKEAVEYWKFDALAGAGALVCSAKDLLSYFQFVSHPPDATSKKIIDKLLEPTFTITPALHVGRGWHIFIQKDKPDIYWHNGGTYGFSTFGAFIREKNKAVIVVVNQFNKNQVSDGLGIAIMNKLLAEQ